MQSSSKALDLWFASLFSPLPKYYFFFFLSSNILLKAKENGFLEGAKEILITSSKACPALQINSSLLGLHLLGWETLSNALSNSADMSIVRITVAEQSARCTQITRWDAQYRIKYSCSCLKLFQRISWGGCEASWIECPLSLETVLFH